MNTPKCLRCETDMEEGILPDYWQNGKCREPIWVPGLPEKSF
ncbi:MAG: hypothetical protein JWO94_569, partial [Verrucomicrobiaceae bacterium]|nr:hypothetical protein [Verrucomicrobiaceae bacterium]